jgi:type I restriction enzyme M protein
MRLSILTRGLDEALIGGVAELAESVDGPVPADSSGIVGFLGRRLPAVNFTLPADSVRGDVLIPRYYDPDIEAGLARFDAECDIKTIGELVAAGLLHLQTGDEVGKLAYGGGDIPFIRTSDFANWELKHDPKQRVAREVFEEYSARQDAKYGDILLVRDGTYLVGATTIVGEVDPPFLFSGGIYRIRCLDPAVLSPYLLLALLNTDIVLRQMRAKQFTRDVIDTLGQRVNEVALPIPKNTETCAWIARKVSELVLRRVELRREALTLGTLLEGK